MITVSIQHPCRDLPGRCLFRTLRCFAVALLGLLYSRKETGVPSDCGVRKVHFGCPAMCPNTLRLGRKLSSRQWSQLFAGLKIPFWMATPHNSSSAADMGRSAAKNKDYEDALAALCRAASMVHVFDYGASRASRPRRFDDSWLRSGSLVGWHSLYWWLIASRFLTHLCF